MMEERRRVQLEGRHGKLGFDLLESIWGRSIHVEISPKAWPNVNTSRKHIDRITKSRNSRQYYGINTGVGALCDVRIDPQDLDTLQRNLLLSHAAGVGPPVPRDLVRWMLLFKIHALSLGYSGIRKETVSVLVQLLNEDLLPLVPSRGSLGASGDLVPLAHLSLPLIGEGKVHDGNRIVEARAALHKHGIKPVTLRAKEGLALINGTQFMTAYGAALCVRALRACKIADVAAAMAVDAIRGSLDPFDERIHEQRRHPGAVAVAENVRTLMAGRPASAESRPQRVQDPYSVRCVPQVHGATRDAIAHAEDVIVREINSVTDNPVVLDNGDIISGGNFHGQPVALVLDYLACGLAELASISERRQFLLLNNQHYGLARALATDAGLNTGLLIAQYVSASLVAENKILCHPASVDSIPTSGGQEDHVSMGATAALKCWDVVDNAETVLAIELVVGAQALDLIKPHRPAPRIGAAQEAIRELVDMVEMDRVLAPDFEHIKQHITSGKLLKELEHSFGV